MKHEYLNKFKYLLKINYREDDCFTYFLKDLKIIISGLEQEIYDNYLNNDESIFLRYASKQAKDLKRCLDNSENIQAEDIKKWFKEYDQTFFDLGSILYLNDELALYKDLSIVVSREQPHSIMDDIFQMQNEFKIFTKAKSVESIVNLLNDYYAKDIENKKTLCNSDIIKWKGTPTELTALIKALIESKVLDNTLTQKKIFENFEQFFDFELKYPDQSMTKLTLRSKDLTPFIDKLKVNLESWIKLKDNQ